MSADYYAKLLGLAEHDQEEFRTMIQEDEFIAKLVEDCAEDWRRRRSPQISPLQIRQMYLARTTLVAAKYGIQHGSSRPVAAAFALHLSDRIEERVWELDQAVQNFEIKRS